MLLLVTVGQVLFPSLFHPVLEPTTKHTARGHQLKCSFSLRWLSTLADPMCVKEVDTFPETNSCPVWTGLHIQLWRSSCALSRKHNCLPGTCRVFSLSPKLENPTHSFKGSLKKMRVILSGKWLYILGEREQNSLQQEEANADFLLFYFLGEE